MNSDKVVKKKSKSELTTYKNALLLCECPIKARELIKEMKLLKEIIIK